MSRSLILFLAGLGAGVVVALAWFAARQPDPAGVDGAAADRLVAELRSQAQIDPRAVLADADILPDELRTEFVDDLTREWALTRPDDFLAYVRSQDRIDELLEGLVSALLIAPQQVLEIAAQYPSLGVDAERTLEESAIAAVTERDAATALAHFESLPPGDRRQRIRDAIAEAWGRRDSVEALDWARSLEPPAPGAIVTVIAATAESDVDGALSLFETFEVPEPGHPSMRSGVARPAAIALSIVSQIMSNAERMRIADSLLQRRTARSMIALQALATHWSQIDQPAATDWLARNAARLPIEMPAGVIAQLAAADAAAAASFADQLPADMRATLAGPIARQLARRDPFAAASWIEQFREHPDYSQLYRSVIETFAGKDPAAAAAMLSSTPPAVELTWQGGTAMHLEGEIIEPWARQDPGAASAWAQGIADPAARLTAVDRLAGHWLASDPERAERLVLGLPQDQVRQEALLNLIGRSLTYGHDLKPATVRAYGLDPSRQEEIAEMLGRQDLDPFRALALVPEWLSDPDIQRQAVERIEARLDRYSLAAGSAN